MAVTEKEWWYSSVGLLMSFLSSCNGVPLVDPAGPLNSDEPQWESVLRCTNISLQRVKTSNLTLGISATVCFLFAIVILILLMYFKQYSTPLQRQFMFLTVLTVIQEAGLAVVLERQFHYPRQEDFCSVLGFVNQCTGTMLYMLTAQIALYLLYIVYKQLKGDPFPRISQSPCLAKLIEAVYLFVPAALVILESGYPYIGGGRYGFSVADCWIQAYDDDCNNIGFEYQVASYGVDSGLGTISITATLVLAVVYCRMAYVYRKVKYPQILLLLRQTLLLMGFLIVSPMILAVGIILRFNRHSFGLSLANSVGITISPLVIPVGYLVYIYTTTHSQAGCCNCKCLKRKAGSSKRRKRGNNHAAQSPITEKYHKTNPTSHPQNYPSETYFDIEQTGEFTHIDIEQVRNTSRKPLTKKKTKAVPYRPVPSSTFFDVEYTGGFTEITEEARSMEGQSLVSTTTDTGYNTMA